MVERLVQGDGFDRRGHEFRYRLASGFVRRGEAVLDAACGTGYGMPILTASDCDTSYTSVEYRGVDRDLSGLEIEYEWMRSQHFLEADLDFWEPSFAFDVAVCFETLEHVGSPERLIGILGRARKWMILSVPVVPTKDANEYHLHDFYPGWLEANIHSPEWRHYQTVQQPSEFSEIAVFERIK